MNYQHRIGARAEYLQQERQNVESSPNLAEKYPELKSLNVMLAYFYPGRPTRHSEIKYTFNLHHARSLFRFTCPNSECVGGNFDLSEELARAVAEHRHNASGEMRCAGWQNKTTIGLVACGHILRYKLGLSYSAGQKSALCSHKNQQAA